MLDVGWENCSEKMHYYYGIFLFRKSPSIKLENANVIFIPEMYISKFLSHIKNSLYQYVQFLRFLNNRDWSIKIFAEKGIVKKFLKFEFLPCWNHVFQFLSPWTRIWPKIANLTRQKFEFCKLWWVKNLRKGGPR